jgi:hypothetical protein
MAINKNDNILVKANKPIDSRYLNVSTPWISVNQVNAEIPEVYRYRGLTVNIGGVEYWYSTGTTDNSLVVKSLGGTITGVTEGLTTINNGQTIKLGGTFTDDVVFTTSGAFSLKYGDDYSSSYDSRSLVDKAYVDNIGSGITPKQAVMVATTGDTALNGLSVIDGYQLQDNDRVLVKDQLNAVENGVYVATGSTWTRSDDFDGNPTVVSGTYMYVLTGDTNANTAFVLITEDPIEIGTSELIFTVFTEQKSITGGLGISATTISGGVQLSVDGASIDGTHMVWTSNTFDLTTTGKTVIDNGLTGGTNGITIVDRQAILGGTLTGDTMITQPYAGVSTFTVGNGTPTTWFGGRLASTRDNTALSGNTSMIGARGDASNYSIINLSATNRIQIASVSGGISRSVDLSVSGLTYGGCYHSSYANRSLVDKEYVDSVAGAFDGSNGLSKVGEYIVLGGSLTGNTSICGGYDMSLGVIGDSLSNLEINATGVTICSDTTNISFSAATVTDNNITPSGLTYGDCYHSSYVNRSLVDKEFVDNCVATVTGAVTFDSDIEVSLCTGKSFGRYCNGDIIPASGKTPAEVILLSVAEPLEPTINLSSHSNNIDFGDSTKSVNLDFSYVINSLGASVSDVCLEYRRGGSWNSLTGGTAATGLTGFLHSINDSGNRFCTTLLEYRYSVYDTIGGSGFTTHCVTPEAYLAPTINPIYSASTLSYESESIREFGNVNTTICGSISSNRSLVDLTEYRILRRVDGGSYICVAGDSGFTSQVKTISPFLDTTTPSSATTVNYKIEVVDEYTTGYSTVHTITHRYASYFGYNTNNPLTSGQILSLGNQELDTNLNRLVGTVTAGVGEYTYYSYPASWGNLSNIIMDGVTPILGAFTHLSDVIVTNNYGETVNNAVYVSNATQAFTNNSLCFQ